jgi:hypothetical protein
MFLQKLFAWIRVRRRGSAQQHIEEKGAPLPKCWQELLDVAKPETGRNAETRSASDRNHSSSGQDRNIATDHNGMAPARRSLVTPHEYVN